jgi:hypothetical protein
VFRRKTEKNGKKRVAHLNILALFSTQTPLALAPRPVEPPKRVVFATFSGAPRRKCFCKNATYERILTGRPGD